MTSKTNPVCRFCGVELTDENWCLSRQEKNDSICKSCHNEENKQWRKMNPEKAKAQWTRKSRKQGHHPYDKNKECPLFFGVHIAEHVLSHTFKNVQRMPMHNHGYDFICGGGYKIDVKSACLRKTWNNWMFNINHNTIADYFLCLAFDNRGDLNPLHVWLIPGGVLNHLISTSISSSTIHKWDEYKLDISKVITCCNVMKGKGEK